MKAKKSLPEGMVVIESSIKFAGLSVFATEEFLSGAKFGPYDGGTIDMQIGCDT